jgi:DNA-binding NarL/FixJ family response regulator
MSTSALRVLLADDHVVIRQGLKAILEQAGLQVVGEASDGHAVLGLCESLRPDVAVLDIRMPLLNGVDCARELARICPATRVMLLTMFADESHVIAGLRAGVAAYVLKSDAASQLLQAIESVSRGDTYLSPGISSAVVQACLSNTQSAEESLSSRERQVLQLIAEGKNMKEIGWLLRISSRTAESHRARLMNRVDIHDVPGLVCYALKLGLVDLERRASQQAPPEAADTAPATWARPKPPGAGRPGTSTAVLRTRSLRT